MAGINMKGLYPESGYRLRYQESLIGQIEKDHADVNRLWDRLQKGTISTSEEKDFRKTICWLRKELTTYKKLVYMGMEGLTSVKIQEIEDDLINKEIKLKIISTSGGDLRPPAQGLSTPGRNEAKR